MAYNGEGQLDRLAQRPQSARKNASAPARDLIAREGLSDTTLVGSGAMIPEMRRSRAEQSLGATGRSSSKQAPSKTRAGVTSGSETMIASELSDHGSASSPVSSKPMSGDVVNIHSKTVNSFGAFTSTDARYPGWVRVAIIVGGTVLIYAAIFALTAFALSVMS